MAKYPAGVNFDRLEEGMDAMRRIGPSGHYVGDAFTLKYFQDAFFAPELLNYEPYEQWSANGRKDPAGSCRREGGGTLKAIRTADA